MCRRLIFLIVLVLTLILTSNVSANLVGHWKFDDGSGSTAQDSSGNGNHGVLNGDPQWINGYLGGALDLDGNGDYVELPISSLLSSLTNSTFATWVDFSNEGGAWQRVFDFGIDTTFNMFLTPRMGDNGVMRFAITITSYNDEDQTTALSTLPSGWHHVAVTLDADNNIHSLYLDGELVAENTNARYTPSSLGETTQNWLGRSQYSADGYFDGSLDDFRIYNRVLTAGHVLDLYNRNPPTFTQAFDPNPQDGAIHPDTWVNLSWKPGDFAASHDIYIGDNFDDVNDGTHDSETFRGNQGMDAMFYIAGFPGYAYEEGLVNGTTYFWRIDEVNDLHSDSPWKGRVWSFMVPPKTAYAPEPADGAELIDLNVVLSWTPGFGAKLHFIVFGEDFDEVNNAAMGVPTGLANYSPGPLKRAKTYYWRIDESDGFETHKGDVWSFTTEGAASGPNPANGAVDIKPSVVLKWDTGAVAESHEVYFGMDANTVANATTTSPEYKGPKVLGEENYDPGNLTLSTTYYWRIDEVNSTSPESPWEGNVWSFTTGDFFVIDDFEDYNTGDNQIWFAWHDGLGAGTPGTPEYLPGNGTGSAVGDETTTSYTEETIVHGGNQSMPIAYDNNKQGFANYSEVEHTLTDQRDWTEEGVTDLSLWFIGMPGNSVEPLYVAVSNSTGTPAVVVHDDFAAVTIDTWTEWIIPLQTLADQGINLSDVDRIAIGMGTQGNITVPGGSGKMFFDDIQLNRPREAAE